MVVPVPVALFHLLRVNSLPNDKISDLSKLKAFADNNSNVNQKLKFASGLVENIVGKGENAGFQQVFQKASSLGSLKVGLCGKELTTRANLK